ncbi:NHS-like protein 1 [Denticeps clupeoides]|uniref:NHS-like protein 1 n=1 Tax=Denticeps clupeoides TaxID=299321 RepID=UPI0010A3E1D7|nr:NHS-like protein 1 [Denticeps clupeoides]XP_028838099.1 NHS-like protein 1 [Denticeps clupeoides]
MEHSSLACNWNGPEGSTFSPKWNGSFTFSLTPDVIKSPPVNQQATGGIKGDIVPPSSSVRDQASGMLQNERTSRPASRLDPHRRSLSLSSTVGSNPAMLRRRCESYAMSYPSSSSEDSGSDSTSTRKDLPDAVPRPRARSIVLRKPKRRPPPPLRTVSLGKHVERRAQSLYIPRDLDNTLLPDLIPVAKSQGNSESGQVLTGEGTSVKAKQGVPSPRPLNELRSSEPCRSQPSSVAVGSSASCEIAKVNADSNISPSSSRSSPTHPTGASPSKPPGSTSPSSGYSSQCETPTPSVHTVLITGPSPLGCRMRPKPTTGQRSRANRVRLSLQLPETPQAPADKSIDQPKPGRRYSDTSTTAKPKQRCSSMFLMPMVTKEDLMNVRLRSVCGSEPENMHEGFVDVIEEESEKDACPSTLQSPGNKPPVAPKPQVSKRPPTLAEKTQYNIPQVPNTQNDAGDRVYAAVMRPKHQRASLLSGCNSGEQQQELQAQQNMIRSPSSSIVETQKTSPSRSAHSAPCDLNECRRSGPPPVAKKPDMVLLHSSNGFAVKDSKSGLNPLSGSLSKVPVDLRDLHVINRDDSPAAQDPSGRSGFRDMEDEIFLQKQACRTTEDLFTIIHRSKRRLLGRKDSIEGRQGDLGVQALGASVKPSSQNDNFMALLRRTRSTRCTSGGRISATELLMSSKPPYPQPPK